MTNFTNLKKNLYYHAKLLFPIHRSLASPGTLETLNFLKKNNKSIKLIKTASGKKVFDWEVPNEWAVKKAFIIDKKTGKKIVDYKNNNLHIVQYSTNVNKTLNYKELKEKLFFDEKKPNAIPYVTSYYKKDWGFCLKYSDFKKIKNSSFKVVIDSHHKKGSMYSGEAFIKGKSKKEILFSSYICHPSMANNELSGIVVLNALIKYVEQKRNRFFSYRFSLAPETIGSLNFIKRNLKNLKKNLIAGFNISCVGDEKRFSMLTSKQENSIADKALLSALFKKKNFIKYNFLERGSDERQFCSPLLNLPYCNFSRSLFGKYKEYHSSLDNLKIISQKGLETSLTCLTTIIDTFEKGIYPKSNNIGEPFLSKYNLYPSNIFKKNPNQTNKKLRDFIAYSDGKLSVFEICKKINCDLSEIQIILDICKNNNLINFRYN